MNKHTTIGIAALVGLGAWAYFTFQWLTLHMIVYLDDGQWVEWSSGFETLWKAWPVLTLGLVLAAILLLAVLQLVAINLEKSEARDKAAFKENLRAEKQKIDQLYQQEKSNLELRESGLRSAWNTLREQEQNAVQALQTMQARVELAERKAAEAEAKQKRAYGGFERIRRKQQASEPKEH